MPRAARRRARGARRVGRVATCFDSLTNQRRRATCDATQPATHLADLARRAVCLTSRRRLVRCGLARRAAACRSPRARCPDGRNGCRRRARGIDRTPMYLPDRLCVTHSQHFPRMHSCDASRAACRGIRAHMVVAGGRVRAARCTDKSAESRRRNALRKMHAVRCVTGVRPAFSIHRTTSSDGSRDRPAVYRCRAGSSMRRP